MTIVLTTHLSLNWHWANVYSRVLFAWTRELRGLCTKLENDNFREIHGNECCVIIAAHLILLTQTLLNALEKKLLQVKRLSALTAFLQSVDLDIKSIYRMSLSFYRVQCLANLFLPPAPGHFMKVYLHIYLANR